MDQPDDSAAHAPPAGAAAFDQFGMDARIEARMLDPDTPVTPEQRDALLRELKDYRAGGSGPRRFHATWENLATRIGVAASTLVSVVQGKYGADDEQVLRKIDQFLADERLKIGRFNAREFAAVDLTHKIKGAIEQGLRHNTIPVIIGEPGSGKSMHARWFCGQRPGAILIEPDGSDCDRAWVIDALYAALGLPGGRRFRRDKKRAVVQYLQRHKNTVIVVDEAQELTASALEMLRRVHDLSDPSGQRNISIVLFGDEDFYKLIVRTRDGARTPISPQITRRMYPVFDCKVHGCRQDKDGQPVAGTVYSKSDIESVTRNQRLRILKDDAIGWLRRLANIHGFGSLGMAMRVFEVACDLKDGRLVSIDDLQLAMTTVVGPDQATEIDEQAGHLLLGKTA